MNSSTKSKTRGLNRNVPTRRHSVAPTGKRQRFGLTLVEAILALLACGLVLVALQFFGLGAMLSAFRAGAVILTLTVLWGLAYLRAPDLTRNATALVVVAVLTISVLPRRALFVRETSRRQTVTNSMRQMGQVIQASQDAGPRGVVEDRLPVDQSSEGAADGDTE